MRVRMRVGGGVVARWRASEAVPVMVDGVPVELSDSAASPWRSATAMSAWLEGQGLRRRRQTVTDLEARTRDERRLLALTLWRQRPGGPDAWMQHVRIDGESDEQRQSRMLEILAKERRRKSR